jgi:hypothetical protein
VRALVPLIGLIILGSLIDVRERTFALEAAASGRGQTGRRTDRRRPASGSLAARRDVVTAVAVVAAVVLGLGR